MSAASATPRAVLVLDVNVLIDAINPQSIHRESALDALADNNGMPIYLSDTMLRTTSIKLLELGMDPDVLREYLELLMTDDDFGPRITVLENVKVTDYKLIDKYGNADYEDSTIVSLMDAAEADSQVPAVLVSGDGALREWCTNHSRTAIRPEQLSRLAGGRHSDLDRAAVQYVSRRAFPAEAIRLDPAQAKSRAKDLVINVRRQSNAMRASDLYERRPELRPQDDTTQVAPESASLER